MAAIGGHLASPMRSPRIHRSQLTIGLQLLERPHAFIVRTVEEVELDGPCITRKIGLELDLRVVRSRFTPGTIYIPLIRPRKGRLLDNLHIRDDQGNSLPTLGHAEHQDFAALALVAAFDEETRHEHAIGDDASKAVLAEVRKQFAGIAHADAAAAQRIRNAIFGDIAQAGARGSVAKNRRLAYLGSFFAERYLVIVPLTIAPDGIVLINYQYSGRYKDPDPSSAWKRALGQRPSSLRFNIPLAYLTQSYHFRLTAPAGHYVHRQRIMSADTPDLKRAVGSSAYEETFLPSASNVLVLGDTERGTNYVHLYVHGLAGDNPVPLFARATFLEEPPGLSLAATWLGLAMSVTLLAVWLLLGRILSISGFSVDFPAFLLALPAFIGLWTQWAPQQVDVVRAPILPRIGMLLIGYLALVSALLYLSYVATFDAKQDTLGLLDHLLWGGLFGVSAVITLWLGARTYRTWRTHDDDKYAEKKFPS